MDSARAATAVVALVMHLVAAGSARGQSIDDEALRRDARRLLTMDLVARLFDAKDRAALSAALQAPNNDGVDQILATHAAIEVTINPEARVSVIRASASLPRFACGIAEPLLIRILNQGRVTSVLNVHLLGEATAPAASLNPVTPHLAGASVEYRLLILTVKSVRPIDLTLGVDAGPGTGDLAFRSHLSMLLQCSVAVADQGRSRRVEAAD
jgi:hypothetical protein